MSDELPVVPGHVVGWRAWVVEVKRVPRLYSLYQDVEWPTGDWLYAEALDGDREPHGVCAARDREHLSTMRRYLRPDQLRYVETGGTLTAIGEVALAGLIVPGERGYRAERARPLSLLLPYAAWELVDELRRAYRVPVGLDNILTKRGVSRGHRS